MDNEEDELASSADNHFCSGQVAIDVMAYDHFLSTTSMTEAERRQFLEAMWRVIVTLMRLGYRIRDQRNQEGRAA